MTKTRTSNQARQQRRRGIAYFEFTPVARRGCAHRWHFRHPLMKTIALTILSLISCNTVFAGPIQVEIGARYEGFGPYYADLVDPTKADHQENLNPTPKVTTKAGQRAIIQIVREVKVPEAPNGEKSVFSGITLEVLPVVKDGQVTLSGKSVVRRRLVQDASQPLGAISFATQETFFNGAVPEGKELTIAVNDGPKHKAHIFLTVELIAP